MKKNDLEIEKSFIDYLVRTIKDENLSSLEVTRTLADKHTLKIKNGLFLMLMDFLSASTSTISIGSMRKDTVHQALAIGPKQKKTLTPVMTTFLGKIHLENLVIYSQQSSKYLQIKLEN